MEQTKADKVKALLKNNKRADISAVNLAQEKYVKSLERDIERTKIFLEQAREASKKLELELPRPQWAPETAKKAEVLALYDAYIRLPYLTTKNDLIGIATAAALTRKAVTEQTETSKALESENSALEDETRQLRAILSDYKSVLALLRERAEQHPTRMAELEDKLHQSQPVEAKLAQKLVQVQAASELAKKTEDRMHQHLKRIVTRLHALLDWENASSVDEATFKKNVLLSLAFINSLVTNLVAENDKWVAVTPPQEVLVQLMLRNNLIQMKERNGYEVRLREFGIE